MTIGGRWLAIEETGHVAVAFELVLRCVSISCSVYIRMKSILVDMLTTFSRRSIEASVCEGLWYRVWLKG